MVKTAKFTANGQVDQFINNYWHSITVNKFNFRVGMGIFNIRECFYFRCEDFGLIYRIHRLLNNFFAASKRQVNRHDICNGAYLFIFARCH